MFKNTLIVFIALSISPMARASLSQPEREHLSHYIKTYQSQMTVKGFLAQLNNPVMPETSIFLHKKTQGYESDRLVKIKFDGKDTISFDLNGKENHITFKSIAEGKYAVNGKDVELSHKLLPNEAWRTILASLTPSSVDKNAFLNWLLPEASAEDTPNSRIAGPLLSVSGATMLADFEKSWKLRKTVIAVGLIVAGEYLTDSGICISMRNDRPECFELEDQLEKLLTAFPDRVAAIKQNAPVPQCPGLGEKPLIDKEATDNFLKPYRNLIHNNSEFFQQASFCMDDVKRELNDCISAITEDLKYLCVDANDKDHKRLPRKPADTK